MCQLSSSVQKCIGYKSSDMVKTYEIDKINDMSRKNGCLIRVSENANPVCCKSPSEARKSADRRREDSVTRGINLGFYYYASFATGYWKSDNFYTREHVGSRRDFYRCSNQIDRFEITSAEVQESFDGLGSGLDYSLHAYRIKCLKYVFRRVESKKITLINKNVGHRDNSDDSNYSRKSRSYCSSSHEREETNEEELQRRLDRATGGETFQRSRMHCSLEKHRALKFSIQSVSLPGEGAGNLAASELREERQRSSATKVREIENFEYSRNANEARGRYAEETLRVSEWNGSVEIWSINGNAAAQKCAWPLRHSADGAPVQKRRPSDGAARRAFLRNARRDDEEDGAALLLYACESVCKLIDVTFTEVTWQCRRIRPKHKA